jgi:hypothetical protein
MKYVYMEVTVMSGEENNCLTHFVFRIVFKKSEFLSSFPFRFTLEHAIRMV